MDRRSFVLSLFGGLAAAGLGGASLAQAATRGTGLPGAVPASGEIDAATASGLDQADAEFTQYGPPRHRGPGPGRRPHRRPPPPPVHRRRRRRVIRNGRVYYVY